MTKCLLSFILWAIMAATQTAIHTNSQSSKEEENKSMLTITNSILYNDYVVSKIYDSASKLPYFQSLIYFSDHTDAVDQGLAHDSGNFVYPMTYIPMYMFFSPDYKAEHETTFNNLKFHQAAVFTNDLIFNTILGVMNIKFPPIYEEKNDFTSNKYDDTPTRFKTLYGAKVIQPYPNNNA